MRHSMRARASSIATFPCGCRVEGSFPTRAYLLHVLRVLMGYGAAHDYLITNADFGALHSNVGKPICHWIASHQHRCQPHVDLTRGRWFGWVFEVNSHLLT